MKARLLLLLATRKGAFFLQPRDQLSASEHNSSVFGNGLIVRCGGLIECTEVYRYWKEGPATNQALSVIELETLGQEKVSPDDGHDHVCL